MIYSGRFDKGRYFLNEDDEMDIFYTWSRGTRPLTTPEIGQGVISASREIRIRNYDLRLI